jgi:hypothetical protein
MTHDEMIAVITAHRDGKKVEFRRNGDDRWGVVDDPVWDFALGEYRIKPEPPKPREWWVNVYSNPDRNCLHTSRERADKCMGNDRIACVHVREVLP